MPRIDPLQLLKCLSVLLSSDGGIKSNEEVARLASLMTKFSKKLVSKCIYVQILRTTETELLGLFMGAGGWNLAHQWLSDAILAQNIPFIKELLQLLIMCPVDVERLKSNNCPKLIKNLTKESSNESVRILACQLVEQWLRIVKGQTVMAPNETPSQVPVIAENVVLTQETTTWDEPVSGEEVEDLEELGACDMNEEEFAKDGIDESVISVSEIEPKSDVVVEVNDIVTEKVIDDCEASTSWEEAPVETLPVYKITIRDGKQVLAKVTNERAPRKQSFDSATIKQDLPKISTNIVVKRPVEIEQKQSKNQTSVLKAKSARPENVDVKKLARDIQKKLLEKSLTEKKMKLIEPSKEKPSDATNEKDRAKERKERELNKLKEKKAEKALSIAEKLAAQAEKDKATLAKLVPPPLSKLGKIPKKPRIEESSKTSDIKKSSSDDKKTVEHKRSPLSPDVKRSSSLVDSKKSSSTSHGRPKTVKSFNSKFRSTGLEEEVKPPSSKQSSSRRTSSSSDKKSSKSDLKRSSPTPKDGAPPEKKLKAIAETPIEEVKKVEKPAPSKPKRLIVLQESDMFMDALTASTKKEPRKRKRRMSASKDGVDKKESISKDDTPPGSPTSEDNLSPAIIKPSPKFYRDTLDSTEDDKNEKREPRENGKDSDYNEMDSKTSLSPKEDSSEISNDDGKTTKAGDGEDASTEESNGLPKGVLVIHKTRKGPKKSVRWKTEKELESVKFFDLDETERVNVTKTFTDMKQMERTTEREGFQLSRKLATDDNMEEKTTWKFPTLIDLPESLNEWGSKSQEKDIQYARESSVLSALYFNRASIPDSASEPDNEMHPAKDPVVIPLDDTTGNPESVMDYRGKPWPEPKPLQVPAAPMVNIFPQNAPPFVPFPPGPGFNNMGPMFPPNNMPPGMMVPNGVMSGPMGGDWRTGDGRVVALDNNMPMDMYNQQGGPAMGMGMGMPGVIGPVGPVGPMGMNYNMMPNGDDSMNNMNNMNNMNMMQGFPMQGPPMPNGPPMFQQFHGNRGPMGPNNMRGNNRGNSGPRGQWFRPNGSMGNNGSWQGRGGPPQKQWSRGVCHQFASRGICRQGNKCTYTH